MRTATAEIPPQIRYPQQNETIASPLYAMCVAASGSALALEISIDGGPWLPCRKEIGNWWYDWSDYADGEHRIVARTRGKAGRWSESAPRLLMVDVLMKRGAAARR